MNATLYLPLRSECLAHYFGSACIIPSRYLPNKPFDIQNKFDSFLLITTRYGIPDTDCCLELVLTKSETKEIVETKEGFFLFPKPLPITRVKSILFSERNQMEQTIGNMTMSTAFIPEKLIKLVDKFDESEIGQLEIPENIAIQDWSSQLKKFNSLLGGFALLHLAGEEYMNYSENYFSSLAIYNSTIESELFNSGKRFKNLFNEPIFKQILPFIQKEINEQTLTQIAEIEKQNILKDNITRLIELDSLENATYVIAVLNTFGVGEESRKKNVDGLILSNFKSEIKPGKSELVALCYGLNRGYSVFNNRYKNADIEKHVKFKLNSLLDYYTIESLYQYSFNEPKSEAFPYLDSWCPHLFEKVMSKSKNDYQILDVLVRGKKKDKVLSQEYLETLLRSYFQKGIEGYFKGFISRIIKTVHDDSKDEIQEDINQKNNEINILQGQLKARAIMQSDYESLKKENFDLKNIHKAEGNNYSEQKNDDSSKEGATPIHLDKIKIAEEIFAYDDLSVKVLEARANEKGINTKGLKKRDIIIQLISCKDNTLFPEK